jgi:tetratricopeptide (TPR) repeat protein
MGALLEAQSDFQGAVAKYNQALALDKEAGNVPGIAVCLHNLGSVYLKLGEHEKAAGYFQRASHVNRWMGRNEAAAQDQREVEKAGTLAK